MRIALLCLVTVSSVAWPRTVAADPIRIVLDGRQVVAVSLVRDDTGLDRQDRQELRGGESASTDVMSPQGHSASAVATLVSDVSDPRHMSGVGAGIAIATVPSTNQIGLSQNLSLPQFNLAFFLDAPHAFDFDGIFTGTDSLDDPQTFSSRTWTAALFATSSGSSTVFRKGRPLSTGTDRVREQGLLQPGEYQILVEQALLEEIHEPGSTMGLQGEFAFRFDLTPSPLVTPEPGSMALLGSGLLGLLGVLRDRRGKS
jgi:hypothetical protein